MSRTIGLKSARVKQATNKNSWTWPRWTDNGSAKADKSKGGFVAIEYVEMEKKYSSVWMILVTNNVVRELSCNSSTWHEIISHYRSFQKQFQIEHGRLFDRSVNKKKERKHERRRIRENIVYLIHIRPENDVIFVLHGIFDYLIFWNSLEVIISWLFKRPK